MERQLSQVMPLPGGRLAGHMLGRAGLGGVAVTALIALAPGCIHVHKDGDGNVKSIELKMSSPTPTGPVSPGPDGGVKQAAAQASAGPIAPSMVPVAPQTAAPSVSLSLPSFSKMSGGSSSVQAAELLVMWDNHILHLPDPTKNGADIGGLVGQVFLLGEAPKMAFVLAEGKIVIEMFDETPRPGNPAPVRLGGWTFDKEVLRSHKVVDERFGKCYALFLPWPDYRPDITQVKLKARYEPEHGYKLFAPDTSLVLDTSPVQGGPTWSHQTLPVTAVPPSIIPQGSGLGGALPVNPPGAPSGFGPAPFGTAPPPGVGFNQPPAGGFSQPMTGFGPQSGAPR